MSGVLVAVLLASARTWALLRMQASWRVAIGPSWGLVAAGLAVIVGVLALLRGQLPMTLELSWFELLGALAFELLLGAVIGLVVALPGWALIGAAEESAGQLECGEGVARVVVLLSLAGALELGVHRFVWIGLLEGVNRFPLGEPLAWGQAILCIDLIGACVTWCCLALALATPVLLSRMLVELCLATLRPGGVASVDLHAVLGPGLRVGVGLLALAAAWSAYPQAFARGVVSMGGP